MSAAETSTWVTASRATTAALRLADVEPADARERIQKLLVTGDNRLKQGVSHEKVRQTYEEALRVAARGRAGGARAAARRDPLADLDRLSGE